MFVTIISLTMSETDILRKFINVFLNGTLAMDDC